MEDYTASAKQAAATYEEPVFSEAYTKQAKLLLIIPTFLTTATLKLSFLNPYWAINKLVIFTCKMQKKLFSYKDL